MKRFDPQIALIFRGRGDELKTIVILEHQNKMMGQFARREKLLRKRGQIWFEVRYHPQLPKPGTVIQLENCQWIGSIDCLWDTKSQRRKELSKSSFIESYLNGKSFQDNSANGFPDVVGRGLKVEEEIPSQSTKSFDESLRPTEKSILLLANEEDPFSLESLARLTAQIGQFLRVKTHFRFLF